MYIDELDFCKMLSSKELSRNLKIELILLYFEKNGSSVELLDCCIEMLAKAYKEIDKLQNFLNSKVKE